MDFVQIAFLLVLASICAGIVRFFKQPLLLGYILAGTILGISGFITDPNSLGALSHIGVTLLLFLLGLEMDIAEIPTIGKSALFTGLAEIILTSTLGFGFARFLGFEVIPSLYIGVALSFASTIIVVKLLSEKRDLQSLYGRIAVGYLLVQDIVAILILMFLSSFGGEPQVFSYSITFLKAIILLCLVILSAKYILPIFFEKYASQSTELLFITSIAWALGFAALVAGPFGFTLEIGGFLAGIALSNLPEHLQIASRARPLRDFFLCFFFVLLGTQISFYGNFLEVLSPAILLSAFILFINPLVVILILSALGYRKRTSFMAGILVAQISEFSLIIMSVGLGLGHIKQHEVSLIVLVGVITMIVSTYYILSAEKLYKLLQPFLSRLERANKNEKIPVSEANVKDHIVLVGCDRTGKTLVSYFQRKEIPFLVIDFNPKVYAKLNAARIPILFGDINDSEILERANIQNARAVISTIGNLADNKTLLSYIHTLKTVPISIFTSSGKHEAVKLYELGATYVLVPEVIAGDYIRNLLKAHGTSKKRFTKAGESHFKRIAENMGM